MREEWLPDMAVVFPVRKCDDGRPEWLFIKKLRKIGVGKWNGPGGIGDPKETPRRIASRELKEELGLVASPLSLTLVAVIDSTTQETEHLFVQGRVWIYFAWKWAGIPVPAPCEVAEPTWFREAPPHEDLMAGDPFWLPRVLSGERLHVKVLYGPERKTLIGDVETSVIPYSLILLDSLHPHRSFAPSP